MLVKFCRIVASEQAGRHLMDSFIYARPLSHRKPLEVSHWKVEPAAGLDQLS